jgi:sigma-B regulation protein RsbU (phosphoserine phosphatase)
MALMEKFEFSLVISDIIMPGRSGLELLQEIRARFQDVFVIMLTSITDTETAMRCMHLGAVDYLIKPFSTDRLRVTVSNALKQRRLFLEQRAYEAELETKVKEQTEQIRVAMLEKALITKEMELARAIQAALIPQYFPCTERLAFAALYRPAGHLGGDYYDLFKRGDGITDVVIADVTGHSVGSALIVAEIRGALQGQPTASNKGCGEMIALINEALYDDLTRAELYVTMFYLRIDEKKMKVCYASAGHNPQMLLRSAGGVEELDAEGMIIGVVPKMVFEEKTTNISVGDRFFLFTDGMVESENREGEQFGAERLSSALHDARVDDSHEALRRVLGAMEQFTVGVPLKDDISLVVATVR